MEIKRVVALYFSPTGNTDKLVHALAEELVSCLDQASDQEQATLSCMERSLCEGMPLEFYDITKPAAREKVFSFTETDLVIVGSPTYAGKLPNKILSWFQGDLVGGGALAVPVVTFGNRSYDNSLAELTFTLEQNGFHTVAGAAFACRHSFTDVLADGRPDWNDKKEAKAFAAQIARKVAGLTEIPAPVQVPGDAAAPYYVPKGTDGQPAKFLKAKPRTDLSKCCNCGVCARVCPMGAIGPNNVADVTGICIKCHACVRRCTRHAKYFDDTAFLSHVAMLEQNYREPLKDNELYL